MRMFSEQRRRWTVLLYSIAQFCWLLACGATVPSTQKYLGSISGSKTSLPANETFSSLWEKRTVHLGQTGGMGLGLLSSPFSAAGSPFGEGGGFPLRIAATLMDNLLIEAGFRHYIDMLKMNPDEELKFRDSYYRRYDPANHILIWCKLQTNWAELYLHLDRWIIFIEDHAVNQYEPVRISEEPLALLPPVPNLPPEGPPDWRYLGWTAYQKNLMLLFPNRDFLENPIISKDVKFLKLIFLSKDDDKTRAEGSWVFKN